MLAIQRKRPYHRRASAAYDKLTRQRQQLLDEFAEIESIYQRMRQKIAHVQISIERLQAAKQQYHLADLPLEILHMIYGHVPAADICAFATTCKLFCAIRFSYVQSAYIYNPSTRPLDFIKYANNSSVHLKLDTAWTIHHDMLAYINTIAGRANYFIDEIAISLPAGRLNITHCDFLSSIHLMNTIERDLVSVTRCSQYIMLHILGINGYFAFPKLKHLFITPQFPTIRGVKPIIITHAPKYIVCNRMTIYVMLLYKLYMPTIFILTDVYKRQTVQIDRDVYHKIVTTSNNLVEFHDQLMQYGNASQPLKIAMLSDQSPFDVLDLHHEIYAESEHKHASTLRFIEQVPINSEMIDIVREVNPDLSEQFILDTYDEEEQEKIDYLRYVLCRRCGVEPPSDLTNLKFI